MNIIVYDTFNEYIASTSYKKDDLCFVKQLGAWYQGGKPKEGKVSYPGCDEHHCDCHHDHGCDCHHDCHPCHSPFPKGLSVINIDGVAYWAWDGYLVKDDEGNFVKVYKTQDLSNFVTKEYVDNNFATKEYVDGKFATKEYVDSKFAALAKIRVNGVLYNLNDGGIIDITLDTSVSVQYNLSHTTSSNTIAKLDKGSSYATTITAESGYELQSVSYTMGGSSFSVSGGQISIAKVTGDIVITATAVKTTPSSYTITYNLTNCSSDNPIISVSAGNPYSATISAAEGYSLGTVKYTMSGQAKTVTNGALYIPSVTGNVVVTGYADKQVFTVTWKAGYGVTGADVIETNVGYGEYRSGVDKDSLFSVNAGMTNASWSPSGSVKITKSTVFTKSARTADSFVIYAAYDNDITSLEIPTTHVEYTTNAITTKTLPAEDFYLEESSDPSSIRLWIPSSKDVSNIALATTSDNASFALKLALVNIGTTSIGGVEYSVYTCNYYTRSAVSDIPHKFKGLGIPCAFVTR